MRTPIRRHALLAAAVTTAFATVLLPTACLQAGALARVDVYDRSAGMALPVYPHRGRSYIEGHVGNEYAVRIRNCTGARLLAVLSVDGVNAVTGETASPDQSGYVIEPWGYVTVQGWRKGLDRTAAFYFTDPHDSYASRTGRPRDLGVIGVALFRERVAEPQQWLSQGDDARAESAPPAAREKSAPSKSSGALAQDRASTEMAAAPPSLGTGHGRGEYSPVVTVPFERANSRPDEVVALRYEVRETLVAMGVLPIDRHRWRGEPEPFPATVGFVPDP